MARPSGRLVGEALTGRDESYAETPSQRVAPVGGRTQRVSAETLRPLAVKERLELGVWQERGGPPLGNYL